MKQSSSSNAAKRIENLLNKEKHQLLSYKPIEKEKGITHKCDYIKLSQIISHMEKLSVQESESKPPEKQRLINLTQTCSGVPINAFDQEVVSIQCCINQKHVNHFFLLDGRNSHDVLTGRNIRRRYREYLLAAKKLKLMTAYTAIPNAKKYLFALLKDENAENKVQDWKPIKMEERQFFMGHTN